MRQICLDTETTGVNPETGDRIVEIGCVEIVGRTLSDAPCHHYHIYLNPEREVPEEVVKVHGLTTEFLSDKPLFADVAQEFIEFVKGAELLIHNAPFDVGFLNMELGRLKLGRLTDYCPQITDTFELARQMFPGLRNSLDALCSRFEIDRSARVLHGALLDARLLAEVYLDMTRKQGSLLGDIYDLGDEIEKVPAPELFVKATVPPEELEVHFKFLEMMAKKSKNGVLWTKALAASDPASADNS